MRSEDESEKSVRGAAHPTSETLRAARKISGAVEIDVRDGFERAARAGLNNAATCCREAAAALACGDRDEAAGFAATAQRSIASAVEALAYLEGL